MPEDLPEPNLETVRLTGHRLLDLLSVIDLDVAEEPPAALFSTVALELAEIGSVSVLIDRDDASVPAHVDVTPLMTATVALLDQLVTAYADETDLDRLAVIGSLRANLDKGIPSN